MRHHRVANRGAGRRGMHRGVTQLLATFGDPAGGTPRPTPLPAPTAPHREPINRPIAGRRGRARPDAGWSPVLAPLIVYQSATTDIGGLFPLLAADGQPAVGARIGYDAHSGAAFYCHPIAWILDGRATNPNMIVFGEPGRGKSSSVAAFWVRMTQFGVKTLIAGDVKGEYSPLLRALGATPITLGPGTPARLNPLDLGPLHHRFHSWPAERQRAHLDGVFGRWVGLLVALAAAQGYPATVTDRSVLSAVLRRLVGADDGYTQLRPVTIPDVHRELADPDERLWRGLRFATVRQFLDDTRPITDALGNLVSGPLAGLFDAPTNITVDWDAPAQSLDLSRLRSRGEQAVAVALTCLGSWSSLMSDLQEDGEIRTVVRDEVWRQLRLGPAAVQAVDADLRLSRRDQRIHILVAHKPSDFHAVGHAGSQEAAIAKDLLALCSTRVLFGQSTRVADDLATDFALTDREQEAITDWAVQPGRPGRALWKIERSTGIKVQTVLSPTERVLFDTNAHLRAKSREFTTTSEPGVNPASTDGT